MKIVRIYKERTLTWWVEEWRERLPGDPPAPDRKLESTDRPADIPNYYRVGLQLCHFRWTAKRAAKKFYNPKIKVRDFKEEII